MPKGSHGLIFECKDSKSFAFMQIIKQKKTFFYGKIWIYEKNCVSLQAIFLEYGEKALI